MLRKRYYILFVSRDEDGRVRKIPIPLQYAYGFVAAALVGALLVARDATAGSVIVTIFPDSGDKYLSEHFWEENA